MKRWLKDQGSVNMVTLESLVEANLSQFPAGMAHRAFIRRSWGAYGITGGVPYKRVRFHTGFIQEVVVLLVSASINHLGTFSWTALRWEDNEKERRGPPGGPRAPSGSPAGTRHYYGGCLGAAAFRPDIQNGRLALAACPLGRLHSVAVAI